MSFLGVRWNRAFILGAALIFWSVMTGLAGFTTKFWQVAVVRIGQSLGEAACTPFATGLIAAYFPAKSKATAMRFGPATVPWCLCPWAVCDRVCVLCVIVQCVQRRDLQRLRLCAERRHGVVPHTRALARKLRH
jgi:hypothetical protein